MTGLGVGREVGRGVGRGVGLAVGRGVDVTTGIELDPGVARAVPGNADIAVLRGKRRPEEDRAVAAAGTRPLQEDVRGIVT